MTNIEIKQKLHQYIEIAQQNKLEAIYAMVKNDIKDIPDLWDDVNFIAELERREANYLNEPSTAYELKSSLTQARSSLKNKSAKSK